MIPQGSSYFSAAGPTVISASEINSTHGPIPPIVWVDDYAVGIPLIDNQHKKLLDLVEKLRRVYYHHNSCIEDALLKPLDELIAYCSEHFETEELVMRAVGYRIEDKHVASHRHFISKASELSAHLRLRLVNPGMILQTIHQCLEEHILQDDLPIAQFFRERSIPTESIQAVSDIQQIQRTQSRWWQRESSVVWVLLGLLLPHYALILWIVYLPTLSSRMLVRIVVSSILLGIVIGCDAIAIIYVKLYLSKSQHERLSHTKQVAVNVFAGEIASRIVNLDLENIEKEMEEVDVRDSYLLLKMMDIATSLRSYLPYLPSTLLTVIQSTAEESFITSDLPLTATTLPSTSEVGGGGAPRTSYSVESVAMDRDTNSELSTSGGVPTANLDKSQKLFGSTYSVNVQPKINSVLLDSGVGGFGQSGFFEMKVQPSIGNLIEDSGNDPNGYGGVGNRVDAMGFSGSSNWTVIPPPNIVAADRFQPLPHRLSNPKKTSMGSREDGLLGHSPHSSSQSIPSPITPRTGLMQPWLQKKTITVLVCSIPTFSAYCAESSAAEVLAFYGHYVGLIEEICKLTRGVLDQISGDRVQLSWNTVNSVGNHADQACQAAIKLRDRFSALVEGTQRLAIAVVSSTALVGTMGTKTRMGFQILGVAPNLAETLALLNTELKSEILISEHTWNDVKDLFLGRLVASVDISNLNGVAYIPGNEHQGIRALMVVELKKRIVQASEEWMYAIQGASKENPYTTLNEVMDHILRGNNGSSESLEGKALWMRKLKEIAEVSEDPVVRLLAKYYDFDGSLGQFAHWKVGWQLVSLQRKSCL